MFVTIDGIDGAGKTTAQRKLVYALAKSGRRVESFRAPGGTPAGEKIREILLSPECDLSPAAMPLLFWADMVHIAEVLIKPALDGGSVVVGDRWVDSTLVYQIFAGRAWTPHERSGLLMCMEAIILKPDVSFILDIPVESAMERIRAANGGVLGDDSFEAAHAGKWEQRRGEYLLLPSRFPGRKYVILDATRSPDELVEHMLSVIHSKRKAA